MNLHDLLLRVRALAAPRRVARELDEELSFHLERDAQRHIANGLSPEDARARARARFGSVALAAEQCRDARGTALVDDLARDILYAFRTFRRAPLAALTIVATVALGLGLVAAVFTVYNILFLRVDAVRSPGELFAVVWQRTGPDNELHGAVHARRLRRDAPRDQRLHGCLRDAVRTRHAHRGPSRGRRARHRELLPGAGRPGSARAHVDAGRRRRRQVCRPAGDRAESRRMAQAVRKAIGP